MVQPIIPQNKSRENGQVLEVAGTILVVLGLASLALGLVSIPLAVPPCLINSCPPLFSWYYAAYWGEIFAGLTMIALGIGLSLLARRIQRRLAAQHSTSTIAPLVNHEL